MIYGMNISLQRTELLSSQTILLQAQETIGPAAGSIYGAV